MRIAILTDTGIDLNPEIQQAMNIHVIKGWVQLGVSLHRDIPTAEVLERMGQGEQFQTILPDLHEMQNAYRTLLDTHDHVLMINISAALDPFYDLAEQVAQEFPGQVTVLDSQAASIGQGMMVLRAAELTREGQSAEQIVATLERLRPQSRHLIALKSLQYMRMNRRVSGMQATLGKMLGVNPVLEVKDGLITPIAQPRGFQNAVNHMQKLGLEYGATHSGARIAFAYTPGSEAELDAMRAALLSTGNFQDFGTHLFGGPIASNTGPGCLSLYVEPAN